MTDGTQLLSRVAAAWLGNDRAGQLSAAVDERALHFERVALAAAALGDQPPPDAADGPEPAGPSPGSLRAWQEARELITVLDRRLRAWAWIPPDRPEAPGTHLAAAGGGRAPALDGYVIAVKDVIDVAGLPTRAGSPLTSPVPARADAPVIARLRAEGPLIAGKSQCTEWALNDPAPTVSPWDPAHTPGGSSAGSAVAVATGMCTASVDTQTAGDVLRPASYNGVVGFKPSAGWVPAIGTVAVAPTIDTIGVMARRVAQAAAVAAAIADEPSRFAPAPMSRPPRIGVLGGVLSGAFGAGGEAAVREHLSRTLRRFAAAGADVVPVSCPVDLALVHACHRVITFAECARQHADRYGRDRERYGPRARELIDLGLLTPAHVYLQAQDVRQDATRRLAGMFGDLDVVALPVAGSAPDRAASAGSGTGDSRLQIPWTLCGFPALCLPTGLDDGRPQAVQLVAARDGDPALLAVASWCEQVLGLRLTPLLPAYGPARRRNSRSG